jgi:ribosomal protein L37E
MRVVVLDNQGHQHCWKCGSQAFNQQRTTQVTLAPGGREIFTKQILRCVQCGECNDVGRSVKSK